jgi:Uma2 family endonuclease
MAEAALRVKMTEDEYLAFERASDERHEYADGEIFAMSGGTGVHGRIAMSVGSELRIALRGRKCGVQSDVRVYIPKTQRYVYPDASVVCGGAEYKDATKDTLLNPQVIVEVLSPSTEGYDRGDKFAQYRSMPSVKHYVLAAQDKPLLEVFTQQDDGSWIYRAYGPGEKAALSAIACELDVDLVYTDVFDESLENLEQANGTS